MKRKEFRIPKLLLLILSITFGAVTMALAIMKLPILCMIMLINAVMMFLSYKDYVEPFNSEDYTCANNISIDRSNVQPIPAPINHYYDASIYDELNNDTATTSNTKKGKKKVFWIITATVLLLAIGVIGRMGSESNDNTNSDILVDDVPEVDDPNATKGEQNALGAAKNYVTVMAFSYEGLISQLLFEGYAQQEATYGVDNCNADWDDMASKSATNYLNTLSFSKDGLVHQLEFDKYTTEQATKAVDNCGADWNEQASKSAKNYLDTLAFSHTGLITQLEFDKFTSEQAKYAADNCDADWNEQAAKSAKNYLDVMDFSRQGLIDQLKFDGFTTEEATYGVEQNGY